MSAEDICAIGKLLADFCHYLDDGEVESWVGLFTFDGVFIRPSVGLRHTGSAELRSFIEGEITDGVRGAHFCLNPAIATDGNEGHATSDFLFVHQPQPRLQVVATGRLIDELRKVDDHWKFAKRTMEVRMTPANTWLQGASRMPYRPRDPEDRRHGQDER